MVPAGKPYVLVENLKLEISYPFMDGKENHIILNGPFAHLTLQSQKFNQFVYVVKE